MEKYTDNQYDDDLTVGTDDYEVEDYSMDDVDLFEFSTDEDSPISRLKTLVLSIDWEITDEVLRQFNEELTDLKGIWADRKIELVYVQALEKISKYIYQKKADAHPNAIKLLLSLYYNLEKIVTSEDLTEAEKKRILLEDVAKFEGLKKVIGKQPRSVSEPSQPTEKEAREQKETERDESVDLINLKAIVLGIDWEITDQDLSDLRKEVVRLEKAYADNRPVLILLQGIGTLGAYIKVKKSNAHADAFKVLHLFYETLEKITSAPMGLEEVKSHLFPAVERFNAFKALIGATIAPESLRTGEDEDTTESESTDGEVAPALSDVPAEESHGFLADEEARALGIEDPDNIADHVDTFFSGPDDDTAEEPDDSAEIEERVEGLGFEDTLLEVDKETALQGVDVEFDDEDEEEEGELSGGPADIFAGEEPLPGLAQADRTDDSIPGDGPAEPALQGVDVETEADDDSDEEALPLIDGELAPALADNDETSIFSEDSLAEASAEEGVGEQIDDRMAGLFGEADEHTYPDVDEGTVESTTDDVLPATEENLLQDEPIGFSEEVDATTLAETDAGDEEILERVESFFPDTVEEEIPGDDQPVAALSDDGAFSEDEEETVFGTSLDGETAEEDVEGDKADLEDAGTLPEDTVAALSDADIDDFGGEESTTDDDEISASVDRFFAEDEIAADQDMMEPEQEEDGENETAELLESILGEEPEAGEASIAVPEEPAEGTALPGEDDVDDAVSPVADAVETELASSLEEIGDLPAADTDEVQDVDELLEAGAESFRLSDGSGETVITALDESEVESLESPTEDLEEQAGVSGLTEMDGEIAGLTFSLPESEAGSRDDEEEVVFELVEDEEEEPDTSSSEPAAVLPPVLDGGDVVANLGMTIESLAIELDREILQEFFEIVQELRESWSDQPLERSFLQLLSTVAQHIEAYGYEASAESLPLLQSIYTSMTTLEGRDPKQKQENLLTETVKVLQWQQDMLARQAVVKDGERHFADPVRGGEAGSDEEDLRETFNRLFDDDGVGHLFDEEVHEEQLVDDASSLERISDDDVGAKNGSTTFDTVDTRDETQLKDEIATLRKSLQSEIERLKKGLEGKGQEP